MGGAGFAAVAAIVFLGACGGQVVLDHEEGAGGAGMPSGGGGTGAEGGGHPDTGSGGGLPLASLLANGEGALYTIDTVTQTVTDVLPLAGCGEEIADVAVDRAGRVFGTSSQGFFAIDTETGGCTLIAQGTFPNSLAILPKGTVVPDEDTLVGYADGVYVRIDPLTGKATSLGSLGGGYFASGDLMAVEGGRAYAVVRGNGCNDCLAEIAPATGAVVEMVGPLGQANVYGLASAGDHAYGVSATGLVLRVDLETAATTPLPLVNAPAGLSFLGAAPFLVPAP